MAFVSQSFSKYKVLPGISYIPEKWEVDENPKLQAKLVHQFIDFLHCVTDLLKLVKAIKTKYLRSRTPLPNTVITEMLTTSSKEKMKAFEHSLLHHLVPVSAELDWILRGGGSTSQSKNFSTVNSLWTQKKKAASTPKKSTGDAKGKEFSMRVYKDLGKILGKKTEPIWQTVAMQRADELIAEVTYQSQTNINLQENSKVPEVKINKTYRYKDGLYTDQHASHILKNSWKRTQPRLEDEVFATLQNARGEKLFEERYEAQVEMIEAYFAGFLTVEEHKDHLEHLKSHWFKDLLQSALHNRMYLTLDVKKAFVKLSEFYNWSDVWLARAKLCFVIQSLPMWAVTRKNMQEAAEFVLKEILEVKEPQRDLQAWLEERELPYVVLPPVVSKEVNPFVLVSGGRKVSRQGKQKEAEPSGHYDRRKSITSHNTGTSQNTADAHVRKISLQLEQQNLSVALASQSEEGT